MKLLYFAWLKAKTGLSEEEVSPPAEVDTVGALMEWLKDRSAGHADALSDLDAVRVAVNQEYADPKHPIAEGDEVAFFPPVTGG